MNTKMLLAAGALTLGFASATHAEDGVIKQDQQRIDQDKADLQKANANVKTAKDAIAADKASGNIDQLKKDREAKKEALRERREEKGRLAKDREERHHDAKHP